MDNVTLKYKFGSNYYSQLFNCAELKENVISEVISGDTFSSVKFEHVKSKRKQYIVTISATDLLYYNISTGKRDYLIFLQNFYCGAEKSILINGVGTYIDVVLDENGTMPIDYLDNVEMFKSVTLTFVEKNPTVARFS